MAIRPITQTMPKQNNTINFEGNKKPSAQQKQTHSTPLTKSVPLAVLIAMSPLAMDATSNNRINREPNTIELVDVYETEKPNTTAVLQVPKIISQKSFNMGIHGNVNVRVLGSANSSNKSLQFDFGDDLITNNNQLVKYNFSIVSDDGSKKHFSHNAVYCYEEAKPTATSIPVILEDKSVIKYMESLKSKYPTAVKTITYNRTLAPNTGGYLQNNASGDIMKNAKPKVSYGKNIGSQEIDGDKEKYIITYYTTDNNENNAEVITLTKKGYPELKVGVAIYHNDKFGIVNTNPQSALQYGQVQLVDANNKTYNIIDNNLTVALDIIQQELTKQKAFNNAYAVLSLSNQYSTTPKGAVYNVD